MHRKHVSGWWAATIAVAFVAFLSGCSLMPARDGREVRPDAPAPVAIREVIALYENIAPSFWPESSTRADYRLFLNVWVDLEIEPNAGRLVRDIRLHDPFGSHWTIPFDAGTLDGQSVVGGWHRLYDTFMSDNGSMLPLRGMTLRVELSDGRIVSQPVDVPPPASTTPDERFLVTEEYRGELTAGHAFAIERASIRGASVGDGVVRVVFGPVDSRATNGRLVLLGEDRELVGESPPFYNDISREPRAFLNRGTRFRHDAQNVVEVASATMRWADGRSAAEVRTVYLVLRDGAQFAFTARSSGYTHLSRSAPFDLGTSPADPQ